MKRTLLALACLLVTASANATLINGGFESGDLTGWTANNPSYVSVDSADVAPDGGAYSAIVYTGLGVDTYTTLSQTFHLDIGETLTGWARWLAGDYLPYNDNGYVKISSPDTTLFYADVATWGDYGASPWIEYMYTASVAGDYTLSAGVANNLDNVQQSALRLDAVTVQGAVPEPATLALLGLGLAGLGFSRRKGVGRVSAA